MSIGINERYLSLANELQKFQQNSLGYCWDKIMMDKPPSPLTWIKALTSPGLNYSHHVLGAPRPLSDSMICLKESQDLEKLLYSYGLL